MLTEIKVKAILDGQFNEIIIGHTIIFH